MMRQRILHTLVVASFGALAMTAAAQTTAPAQTDTPRNAPVGNAVGAPAVGGNAGGTMAPGHPAMNNAPTGSINGDVPHDMSGYKTARTACDNEPVAGRDQCRTNLNTRYSAVAPKCQKLSSSALDDCLKGADTAGK
jgi:hypothetical protein